MSIDLLDLDGGPLYFDEALAPEAERLLHRAAALYGEPDAELLLLRAFLIAPENLTVLVAIYRFYYFQHRFGEALEVAERACLSAGRRIGFPPEWRRLDSAHLASAVTQSMGLVRFYLLALKAAGYVCFRLGRDEEGRARLKQVRLLDPQDRLGAGALLDVIDARDAVETA